MLRVTRRPWWVALEYVPADMWVGAYWCWKPAHYWTQYGLITLELHVYVCLLPCLPLHLVIGRLAREERAV